MRSLADIEVHHSIAESRKQTVQPMRREQPYGKKTIATHCSRPNHMRPATIERTRPLLASTAWKVGLETPREGVE